MHLRQRYSQFGAGANAARHCVGTNAFGGTFARLLLFSKAFCCLCRTCLQSLMVGCVCMHAGETMHCCIYRLQVTNEETVELRTFQVENTATHYNVSFIPSHTANLAEICLLILGQLRTLQEILMVRCVCAQGGKSTAHVAFDIHSPTRNTCNGHSAHFSTPTYAFAPWTRTITHG